MDYITITTKPIIPADARRIAVEAGPVIKKIYDEEGLTCYREEIEVGKTIMVQEGYIRVTILPMGKMIVTKVPTKVITRMEAEDND